MSKKLSLMIMCAALIGAGVSGCNESGHWLECSQDQEGQEFCVNGQQVRCTYHEHNHNDKEDGFFFAPVLDDNGEVVACTPPEEKPENYCAEAGQTRCINGTLETCGSDNLWGNPQTCAAKFVCGYDDENDRNACIVDPEFDCSAAGAGATRCTEADDENASQLQTCVADGDYLLWSDPAACEGQNEYCGTIADGTAACVECDAGVSVCDGKSIDVCSADGKWNTGTTSCNFTCAETTDDDGRTTAACAGECTPGDTQCNTDNTGIQTCGDDYFWSEAVLCIAENFEQCVTKDENDNDIPATCLAIAECTPGETKCDDDNTGVITCDDNGFWATDADLCEDFQTCGDKQIDDETTVKACIAKDPCELTSFKAECNPDGTITECIADAEDATTYHVNNKKCSEDATSICNKEADDDEASCVDVYIGRPCTCEPGTAVGNVCHWNLDGNEIRKMINSSNTHFSTLYEAINEKDATHPGADIPNIFASKYIQSNDDNIDKLTETLPDGMVIGCYRDANIEFSQLMDDDKVEDVVNAIIGDYALSIVKQRYDEVCTELAESNNVATCTALTYSSLSETDKKKVDDAIDEFVTNNLGFPLNNFKTVAIDLARFFLKDIKMTAEGGYLIAGAIEASGFTVDEGNAFGYRVLTQDRISKLSTQAKKINSGDYAAASNATCPAGTLLVNYVIGSRNVYGADVIASGDLNSAICLRKCQSAEDTNSCGANSTCTEIVTSIDGTGSFDVNTQIASGTKSFACVDKAALEQFHEMFDKADINLEQTASGN